MHAHWKNEFREDEKGHNHMRWLNWYACFTHHAYKPEPREIGKDWEKSMSGIFEACMPMLCLWYKHQKKIIFSTFILTCPAALSCIEMTGTSVDKTVDPDQTAPAI